MPPALVAALPTIISVAGTAASALGKKGNTPAANPTGFDALPQPVQDAWLKTYLPQALAVDQKKFQGMPMTRANTNPGIFDSQGLADLQRYSDSVGGIFNPRTQAGGATANGASSTQQVAVPGGDNGYDGSAKNGDVREFTAETWMPGAPAPGKYIYNNGWKPFAGIGY